MSQLELGAIESGKYKLSKEQIQRIAKAFGVSVEIFIIVGLEKESVAENKREAFDLLMPSIKLLIGEIIIK